MRAPGEPPPVSPGLSSRSQAGPHSPAARQKTFPLRRVRKWHCCHSLPSEPDVIVSHHPAQAVGKPRASGAGVTTHRDQRRARAFLSLSRDSKYPYQPRSNGLASDLTFTCRRMRVLVGSTNQAIIGGAGCGLGPAAAAKHHFRPPSRCQYRFAIQAEVLFGWRNFAHRQSECQRTIPVFRYAEDAEI